MKFFTVFFLIVIASTPYFAQLDSVKVRQIDSLKVKLNADSLRTFRPKSFRFYAHIDNRTSFVKPSNFNGYQLGFKLHETYTYGLGFYRLNQAEYVNSAISKGYQLRSLNYNTIFYQKILAKERYFEVDLLFEIGLGVYRARISDTLRADFNRRFTAGFIPLSSNIKFIAKPKRWIGISVALGYAKFLDKQKVLDFDGFYIPIGLWLDLRQVYREIKYYGFQKKRYRHEVWKITVG